MDNIDRKSLYPQVLVFLIIMFGFSAGCIEGISPSVSRTPSHETGNVHDNAGPVSFTDTQGNAIILPHPARKIVAKNGMAAEVLVGIGEGDTIVGATYALYSERYLIDRMPNVRSIGPYGDPSLEYIIALKPDIVINYDSYDSQMEMLTESDIPVIHMDCSIRDLPSDTRKLGVLTGNISGSERYAGFFEHYLDLVQERLANLTEDQRQEAI